MASHANVMERRSTAIETLTSLPGGETISDDARLRLKRDQSINLELLELIVALFASVNSQIS
jgi:hypothetical protein